jgi:hypothetical protein
MAVDLNNPALGASPRLRPRARLVPGTGLIKMGRQEGIGLSAKGLQSPRSTTELLPPYTRALGFWFRDSDLRVFVFTTPLIIMLA